MERSIHLWPRESQSFVPGTDWAVSPSNSHVEALALSVTVFGARAFKEAIKANKVVMDGGPMLTGLLSL